MWQQMAAAKGKMSARVAELRRQLLAQEETKESVFEGTHFCASAPELSDERVLELVLELLKSRMLLATSGASPHPGTLGKVELVPQSWVRCTLPPAKVG